MRLNDNIINFIEQESRQRNWVNPRTGEISVRALATNLGLTEATWSRIMRKKQDSIKDKVVDAILDTFDISPIEFLEMSIGQTPQNKTQQIAEPDPSYHDKHDRLANWLRSEATHTAAEAIYATAAALGFHPKPNGGSNHE